MSGYRCKFCDERIVIAPETRKPTCEACGVEYLEVTAEFYQWWYGKLAKMDGITPKGEEAPFDRKELWSIQARAERAARAVTDRGWQVAFLRLAEAANVLDAFIARSSIPKKDKTVESIAEQMEESIDILDKDA